MDPGLGLQLPQRTSVIWLLLATAVILLVPVARLARRSLRERGGRRLAAWVMTAVLALVVVATPLAVAWGLHRDHVFVSDEAVTRTRGDEVTQQLRFADVEEVRVRFDGDPAPLTPGWFAQAVVLVGTDASGARREVRVTRVGVTSVGPLLRRIVDEVERRPALLRDDDERALFEAALADAR